MKTHNLPSSSGGGVTKRKIDRLSHKLGLTSENLEKAKRANPEAHCSQHGHRQNHIDNIRDFAPELCCEFGEGTLFSAAAILAGLFVLRPGLYRDPAIRGPNFISDALGGQGLNLPSIVKNGKMRYAIAFIDASKKEKAAAQERLNNLSKLEMKALPVA